MTIFENVLISIKRHPVRTTILFFAIFILMSFMSVAISLSHGMLNTDALLRARFPTVATVVVDYEALMIADELGESDEFQWVMPVLLREIGELPYVRAFDYTAEGNHFYSENIVRVFLDDLFLELEPPIRGVDDNGSLAIWGIRGLEEFMVRGVHYPEMVDIQSGLIDLVEGRTFTQEEIDTAANVVMLSRPFLEANQLELGDIFALDFRIYRNEALADGGVFTRAEVYLDEHLWLSETFEFEIIGVFDQAFEVLSHFDLFDVERHIGLMNRIYVPSGIPEATVEMLINFWSEVNDDETILTSFLERESIEEFVRYRDFMFLLYDPTYLPVFSEAASNLLPDFWHVLDLSHAYGDFAASMSVVEGLAQRMIYVGMVGILLILCLLVLLFLRERRHEIGIYLALGAAKKEIILQLFFEFFIIAVFGITCALLAGHQMASHLSASMLRQEMMQLAEDEMRITSYQYDSPQGLGFVVDLSMEELINLNDTTLTPQIVLAFYGFSLTTLFISIVFPTWLLMRSNLKNILALHQI